ncbi:MAG: ATP-binding protein [Deltaproteobacteria bacterium]|nr:ATP-binding protein [Deltaproteobacteria bacterium]
MAATILVCLLPTVLNLLGVDFGTPGLPLDLQGLGGMPRETALDAVIHSQEGNFVHTILEWSAYSVAVFTILLAFLHYSITREVATLIIGLALFFAGLMDALHVLAADRLIGDVSNYPNFVAISGAIRRFFTALIIVSGASIFLLRGAFRSKAGYRFLIPAMLFLSGLAYGIIWVCDHIEHLPQAIFPSDFVTRPYDLAALLVFLAGGLLIMPRFYRKSPTFLSQALAISFIPQIFTQLHMVFGSRALFDNHYNISHFLKVVAYLVPFAGLGLDYLRTYRQMDAEVSERKRAEESLASSVSLLQATLESTGDGLLAVNTDGQVISVNQKFAGMWGVPLSRLTTLDLNQRLDILSDQVTNPLEFREKVEQLRRQPEAESYDVIQLKDGRIFERYSQPQHLRQKVVGRVWSFRDVTARRRAEEALRKEEERLLAGIFSSVQDGLCILNSQYTITHVNPVMEQWYSHKMPLVGQKCYAVLGQRTEVCEDCSCRTALETGIGISAEIPRLGPKGEAGWLNLFAFPLLDQASGVTKGVVLFLRDVTKQRHAEKTLQRYAAELERANEDVKQFAYIVSHDLRAPLVNMKGFASELRAALGDLNTAWNSALPHLSEKEVQISTRALQEDIPEALDFIDSSASRMDDFISALLKLSRLGRKELCLERFAPRDLIEPVLKSLAHQLSKGHVKVTVGPLPEVLADRTGMEQIFGNILTNAVNYLDPGRPGEIEINGESVDGETIFSIRDNGRGIAKEDLDKVFAPFRRAGKQNVKGEGMGMAYVQTLVRRHGGHVRCESEPGVGTTFVVSLPDHPEIGGGHG